VSFLLWLRRVAWHLPRQSKTGVRASIEQGIAELEAAGTTHVGEVTNTWQSVEPLLESALQGVVYLEVVGLERKHALLRLNKAKAAINCARAHPRIGRVQVGLSLHAPYSCHRDLLRAGAAWCREKRVPLCIHVAESPSETALLLHDATPGLPWLARFAAQALGLLPLRVPHLRPVTYLASLGVLEARPLLVHAIHVTDREIQLIARAGCSVVHCPRSNAHLSCGRMPLERYLDAGVTVYLGTDSRASSPSLDVRQEAEFAKELHRRTVSPERIDALAQQSFPGRRLDSGVNSC
jgi:cytosine/adenosine deaminase-related metal-dependent hydrolase